MIRVVGIGCHPAQLTGEAEAAIRACDYVLAARKSEDDDLLRVRRECCARLAVPLVEVSDPPRDRDDPADYGRAVADWHRAREDAWVEVIASRPGDVGFLVWGDPALYDSTIRIVERLAERLDTTYEVIAGVSSVALLAARHRIPLHEVGQPVVITPARRLSAEVGRGATNLVVVLDGGLRCRSLVGEGWSIWWGANLGAPSQELVSGPLDVVLPDVEIARDRARAAAGWVMDVYLLRRSPA